MLPEHRTGQRTKTRSTLTADDKAAAYSEDIGQTGRVVSAGEVGGTRSFLPAVEGMRACAAVGVVITHVAFQTGHTTWSTGRLLGRFDLAVAVFFALSGFLLWRGHAAAARGLRLRPPTGHYLRSRIVRIMPGYLLAVVVILSLLPDASSGPDGVAGQPDADADLRAVDVDRPA